jgi:hypothetical protein
MGPVLHLRTLVFAGVSLGLLGCQGIIDEPNWMPPDDEFYEAEVDFECTADRAPVDAPLRRLSRSQLEHTVRDTLIALLGEGEAAVVMNEVDREMGAIPGDLRTTDGDQQAGQLAFASTRSAPRASPSATRTGRASTGSSAALAT